MEEKEALINIQVDGQDLDPFKFHRPDKIRRMQRCYKGGRKGEGGEEFIFQKGLYKSS